MIGAAAHNPSDGQTPTVASETVQKLLEKQGYLPPSVPYAVAAVWLRLAPLRGSASNGVELLDFLFIELCKNQSSNVPKPK